MIYNEDNFKDHLQLLRKQNQQRNKTKPKRKDMRMSGRRRKEERSKIINGPA